MAYIDATESLSVNIFFLRLFGFYPPSAREPTKRKFYHWYAAIYLFLAYFLYMCAELGGVLSNLPDLQATAESSFLFLTHLAQMTKVYHFLRKSKLIREMVDQLNCDTFRPKNAVQESIMRYSIRRAKLETAVFLGMAAGCIILWATFPFLERKSEDERILPLPSKYPIDVRPSPNYELAFTYQIVGCFTNAFANICKDTFASGIMINAGCQLKMLANSIENVKEQSLMELERRADRRNSFGSGKYQFTDEEIEKVMLKNYHKCIVHHKMIVEFVRKIDFVFSKPAFSQFVASSLIICITMFELTVVKLFSLQFFGLVLYQNCMLMEIFVYCWHGNEIILSSTEIPGAVYRSNWLNTTKSYRRRLQILMIRASKPLHVTGGGFFILSVNTFMAILKTAWSFFAVLRTVHSDDSKPS